MEEMTNVVAEEGYVAESVAPVEEVAESEKSGNGLAIGLVVAATAVAGGLVYQKIVKPWRAKRKAAKGIVDATIEDVEDYDADQFADEDQTPVK